MTIHQFFQMLIDGDDLEEGTVQLLLTPDSDTHLALDGWSLAESLDLRTK
jgi:hypothetical protein